MDHLARRMVAVFLAVMLTVATVPVSAAVPVSRSSIGSISVAGPVELRGHPVSSEGTLFAGDRIRAGEKAYAKLQFKDGSRLELGAQSEISLNPWGETVQIAMATGSLGFTAMGRSSVRIALQPFEIIATDGAAGNLSVTSGSAAGVRAVRGAITVHNTKTSERIVVNSGDERWFSTENATVAPSLGEIAANIPDPMPSMPPQTPAGQSGSGGLAMDAGAWAAVAIGAAVTGIAVWGLKVALDNRDEISGLRDQIDGLSDQVGSNADALAAMQQAAALSDAALQARLNALAIALTANQAAAAVQAAPNLTAAQRAEFTARAQSLSSQANSATQTILALESQLNSLEAQIASSGTITPAQIAQLDTLRTQLNAAIQNLNTIRQQETLLLQDLSNAGVTGITQTSQNTGAASASLPEK